MTHVLFLLAAFVAVSFGDEVKNGDFPFYALINRPGHSYCGGAILTTTLVILPAHCLDGLSSPTDVSVYVGAAAAEDIMLSYKAKEVIFHKDYNNASRSSDIAFLVVNRKFEFNSNVSAVELAQYGKNVDRFIRLVGFTVIGIGETYFDRFPELMKTYVENTQDLSTCKNYFIKYNKSNPIEITNNNTCTYPNSFVSKISDTYILLNLNKELIGIANYMIRNSVAPHVFTLLQPYENVISEMKEKYP